MFRGLDKNMRQLAGWRATSFLAPNRLRIVLSLDSDGFLPADRALPASIDLRRWAAPRARFFVAFVQADKMLLLSSCDEPGTRFRACQDRPDDNHGFPGFVGNQK
jgi:hypothetical protein